eukprot:6419693-Prymnesium_polylepis.1
MTTAFRWCCWPCTSPLWMPFGSKMNPPPCGPITGSAQRAQSEAKAHRGHAGAHSLHVYAHPSWSGARAFTLHKPVAKCPLDEVVRKARGVISLHAEPGEVGRPAGDDRRVPLCANVVQINEPLQHPAAAIVMVAAGGVVVGHYGVAEVGQHVAADQTLNASKVEFDRLPN